MLTTAIGTTTPDTVVVRDRDLAKDLIGTIDFVDMMVLTMLDRLPDADEKAVLNALLVTVTDHGLTPSAIAARLTYLGAPEALQGAVASGLLGAGSVFLGTTQDAAEMLRDAAADLPDDAGDEQVRDAARAMIAAQRQARRPVYGLGHPIHVFGDPRVPRLRDICRAHGAYGSAWRLLDAAAEVLRRDRGKDIPANGAGAVGASVVGLGLDPLIARGLGLIGRTAGLVAHVLEEREHPLGQEIWDVVLAQDPNNARA